MEGAESTLPAYFVTVQIRSFPDCEAPVVLRKLVLVACAANAVRRTRH